MHLDAEKEMMSQCVALLGKFIAVREPNIRYLGLVSWGGTLDLSVFLFSGSFLSSFPLVWKEEQGLHDQYSVVDLIVS